MRNILVALAVLPSLCLAQGQTTDWSTVKAGTFSTSAAAQALSRASIVGWTNAASFTLLTAVRDANEAIVTGTVRWPDGSSGVFTTDTASSACPGAIDAYHITYVPLAGSSETIAQAAVTRDPACAVVAQPVPILSP